MPQIIVPRHTLDVVLTCDPAISEKSSACRTAIVAVGMSPGSRLFVLETWAGRQGDPFKVIDQLLEMAYRWQPRVIGIEAVAYQAALLPFMERVMHERHIWYSVLPLHPDRNEKKESRIKSLQPFFRTGQIYLQRGMLDLIEEYETFPYGRTNDLLDALAHAIRMVVPQEMPKAPGLDNRLRELARRDPGAAQYWRQVAEKEGRLERLPGIDDLLEQDEEVFAVGMGEL